MVLLLAALLQTAAPAVPAPPAAVAAPAPKIAKKPELVSEDTPWPAEARALGHHGTVMLSALIKVDGSVADIKLEESSRSPLLDDAAMKAVANWKFKPARDASGNPVEIRAKLPVAYAGDNQGPGYLIRYRCDAFTRDVNWWRSVHTEETDKQDTLYYLILGARFITQPGGMMAGGADGLKKTNARHQSEWNEAIKTCAAKPDALLVDQFSISRELKALANLRE